MNKSDEFQTPAAVAKYMVDMVPSWATSVLEPTPGKGAIVNELISAGVSEIIAPSDFFQLERRWFGAVVMNPPFSDKYTFGIPEHITERGMKIGYRILFDCMKMSNHVIALMPWFIILDSTVRLENLRKYGLKSITALPRSTFNYARIQCCILELRNGWTGSTDFRTFKF
mgnify:CR=1 FL=1